MLRWGLVFGWVYLCPYPPLRRTPPAHSCPLLMTQMQVTQQLPMRVGDERTRKEIKADAPPAPVHGSGWLSVWKCRPVAPPSPAVQRAAHAGAPLPAPSGTEHLLRRVVAKDPPVTELHFGNGSDESLIDENHHYFPRVHIPITFLFAASLLNHVQGIDFGWVFSFEISP